MPNQGKLVWIWVFLEYLDMYYSKSIWHNTIICTWYDELNEMWYFIWYHSLFLSLPLWNRSYFILNSTNRSSATSAWRTHSVLVSLNRSRPHVTPALAIRLEFTYRFIQNDEHILVLDFLVKRSFHRIAERYEHVSCDVKFISSTAYNFEMEILLYQI